MVAFVLLWRHAVYVLPLSLLAHCCIRLTLGKKVYRSYYCYCSSCCCIRFCCCCYCNYYDDNDYYDYYDDYDYD